MKILFFIIILILMTGCASHKPVEFNTVEEKIECVKPPLPSKANFNEVEFVIVEVNGVIYYGLTTENYQLLSKNMQEIIKHLKQNKKWVEYVNNKC